MREVSGNAKSYKNVFEGGDKSNVWVTTSEKFFMITSRRKAAYADTTSMSQLATRAAFKVARIQSGDSLYGIQPESRVPDMSKINIDKYIKGYCVSIGEDKLW